MLLYYLDESYDASKFAMSAIRVESVKWTNIFKQVKEFRRELKDKYGIYTTKEIHSTDFVRGKGKIAPDFVSKPMRAQAFHEMLLFLTKQPVQILNACIEQKGHADGHLFALERLLNRIQVNASKLGQEFMLIIDEGREGEIRKLTRKMTVHNYITSKVGAWADGSPAKNIGLDRLIEDPTFKTSDSSYFLQFADCVAFSLLKSEVPPTPNIEELKIQPMFESLKPVLCLEAFKADPRKLGIIRGM